MKKAIAIICILVLVSVLLIGCVPKEKTPTQKPVSNIDLPEPQVEEKTEPEMETGTAQSEPETTENNEEPKEVKVDVSQEELDALKSKIDGLNFEDLEGLS